MKTILITGGAGFIGSNFISYFLKKYKNYFIINLDKLTYAGNLENLGEVKNHSRYKFIKGDICNRDLIEYISKDFDIKGIIHFAAETHVDKSIKNPGIFIKTNIIGTYILIDVALKYWMKIPFKYKDGYKECRFHHISTDEVYGTLGKDGLFREDTPYAPNSPYSASKASSDMCVEKNREIFAYGILRRADNPRINLTRMKLVDLQTIDNDKIVIEEIIKSCIKKCTREKISVFEIIGYNSKKINVIEKYNPLKRELQSWPFFYKVNNKDLDLELENSGVWDICEYDGDASLI